MSKTRTKSASRSASAKSKPKSSASGATVKPTKSETAPKVWWHSGVQFECQGSGKCCVSHGEYGFVFVSKEDRVRFARHFKMNVRSFTKKYCAKHGGAFHLIEDPKNPDCMFLKNKQCTVYPARPTQCRTWPFWPEVMNPKSWKKEVQSFCPGVGKGKFHSREEIEKQLKEQSKCEDGILSEAARVTENG